MCDRLPIGDGNVALSIGGILAASVSHPPKRPKNSGREQTGSGQSHTIGVVLLTGVVVVLVGASSVIVLHQMGGTDEPLLDASISITDESLEITHGGGDSIERADLFVLVRTDGGTDRYRFELGSIVGDADGRFEPSERVRLEHGRPPGPVTVLVVHRPSNTVLAREDAAVPGTSTARLEPTD